MTIRRLFPILGLFLALILPAFLAGYFARAAFPGMEHQFAILTEAYSLLENHGYSAVPKDSSLEYGMIRGMLEAYGDPFSTFVEPAQHEIESDNLAGSFGGIGVNFERNQNGHILLYPLPDSPAEQAGVQAGDGLMAVEDL